MDKLPKKEDLLPQQTSKPQASTPSGKGEETDAVKHAKDQQVIAEAENKKVEAEIKTQLAQQGYKNLEEAVKDINEKKAETDRMLESTQQIQENAIKTQEEYETLKQKAVHALEILKEREERVNARLERSITTENTFKEQDKRYAIVKQELQEIIDYHKENIGPCVKALRMVSKSIYSWIDLLNQTPFDFAVLYNYIGKITRVLDNYVERIPTTIPEDVIPKEDESDEL